MTLCASQLFAQLHQPLPSNLIAVNTLINMATVKICLTAAIITIAVSAVYAVPPPLPIDYLSLSDDKLWCAVTGGNRAGKCHISVCGGACDVYVKSAIRGDDGDYGYPKATRNGRKVGTGCVKAPDFPKRRTVCFFDKSYNLPPPTVAKFCTNRGKDNALAIIRHAIRNNACDIPSLCKKDYLSLPLHELFKHLTDGKTAGKCRIVVSPKAGACYFYAKAGIVGSDGDYGWPKNNRYGRKVGTGCVKAPYLPKQVRKCYYSDPGYQLPWNIVRELCTDDGRYNAVSQIRHAMRNNACMLPC